MIAIPIRHPLFPRAPAQDAIAHYNSSASNQFLGVFGVALLARYRVNHKNWF